MRLQPFMTLNRQRLVQKSQWFNRSSQQDVWGNQDFYVPHSATANDRVHAEGHHAPISASASRALSHMLSVIMSRYVILSAGRSWQSEKQCMNFYQLVNTSWVIIPQCNRGAEHDFFLDFWGRRQLSHPSLDTGHCLSPLCVKPFICLQKVIL